MFLTYIKFNAYLSCAVGMMQLLAVMEGVQGLLAPLLDHNLEEEEADGVPLDDLPPLLEQMLLSACLYSL